MRACARAEYHVGQSQRPVSQLARAARARIVPKVLLIPGTVMVDQLVQAAVAPVTDELRTVMRECGSPPTAP